MTTLKIRDLKHSARQLLTGNYGSLAVTAILLACTNFFLSYVSLLAVPAIGGWLGLVLDFASLAITNMVYTLLLAGMYRLYFQLSEHQPIRLGDLLFAFRNHPEPVAAFSVLSVIVECAVLNLIPLCYVRFGRSIPFMIITVVLILLLIWYTLTFSAVLFFYAADPWRSFPDYLRLSMQVMKGFRIRFFFLLLSFLGVFLLGLLSFGIGLALVVPYVLMTQTLFFRTRAGQEHLL